MREIFDSFQYSLSRELFNNCKQKLYSLLNFHNKLKLKKLRYVDFKSLKHNTIKPYAIRLNQSITRPE
jgi:hypothetical protein